MIPNPNSFLSIFRIIVFTQLIISKVTCLPSTIRNDAVREMDGISVWGRGYSITTNSFQTSCVETGNNTVSSSPSYDFDYLFLDLTEKQNLETNLRGTIGLFSHNKIKSHLLHQVQTDIDQNQNQYTVVVSMRTEMFMTSDIAEEAKMTVHAENLLRNKEYVNFFRACGPNYVRSVHRAQEVTAIIQYQAANEYHAQRFADAMKRYVYGNRGKFHREGSVEGYLDGFNINLDFDDSLIQKTLTIDITAYGLGLNLNGSKSLVATNLDEFNDVMKFAFDSMTKRSTDVDGNSMQEKGLLYEVEVVPWADHTGFFDMVHLDYNRIRIPTPRGMIENAVLDHHGGKQISFSCSIPSLKSDSFGKCCLPNEMINEAFVNEMGHTSSTKRCNPKMYLSPLVMKDNLETNAEFVAWISEVARNKVKKLSDLGQCVNALRALPDRFDYHFVQASDQATFDEDVDMAFTVKELKAAFDPVGDLSIINMVGDENDEYFEMFYEPCMQALYGMNLGMNKDTDPKYFMAQPWYNIEECSRASCMEPNMAWDRIKGGKCVNGLMRRVDAMDSIPMHSDPNCAKKLNPLTGEMSCKYGYNPDANIVLQMDNCRETLPRGKDSRGRSIVLSMEYLLEYFCLPRVSSERADSLRMDEVDHRLDICMTEVDNTTPSQVPSETPTISVEPSSLPTVSANPSSSPSVQPTDVPSTIPTSKPSTNPSIAPSSIPSESPSNHPSGVPSTTPTSDPSSIPSDRPSQEPTNQPSLVPSETPTNQPSEVPSTTPTSDPSSMPSNHPSEMPTNQPSSVPSESPTNQPSGVPSTTPTSDPSSIPSTTPTSVPSSIPSTTPTSDPSSIPSDHPSEVPTNQPTGSPSEEPTKQPTGSPSSDPSPQPSSQPSKPPTKAPTRDPTPSPTRDPTPSPTQCVRNGVRCIGSRCSICCAGRAVVDDDNRTFCGCLPGSIKCGSTLFSDRYNICSRCCFGYRVDDGFFWDDYYCR